MTQLQSKDFLKHLTFLTCQDLKRIQTFFKNQHRNNVQLILDVCLQSSHIRCHFYICLGQIANVSFDLTFIYLVFHAMNIKVIIY